MATGTISQDSAGLYSVSRSNPTSPPYSNGPYVWDQDLILNSRIVTGTSISGSAVSIASTYAYGEAWELRWTSALSNTQFQGIFLEVRTSVANTSTIRGMEVHAAQEGAVDVGVLEGANFQAITRSTSTGNITNLFGLTGEITHNSSAYTGTVTLAAAVRGKVSLEDGTTYTESCVFLAQSEPITGADTLSSVLLLDIHANVTVTSLINAADATCTNFYEVDADGDGGVVLSAIPNANPESDAEDGYIKVLVGAVTYAIPIYNTAA